MHLCFAVAIVFTYDSGVLSAFLSHVKAQQNAYFAQALLPMKHPSEVTLEMYSPPLAPPFSLSQPSQQPAEK
ncbi:hypothetical protein F4779DRAFT_195535 [Xylariaceae sp. FL0662B]|nr:hypothetical protein F4779DRAFT_195535 [Xylariaceae sp. FL0662B]